MARSNSLQLKAHLLKKALIFSAFFYASFLFSFSLALAAGSCPPQHIDETARVNYVYDGDTLQLEDGRKIRLLGIDTPEIFSRKKVIPRDIKAKGEAARAALQKMLNTSKQQVSLAYGAQRFDRYKRTLAHVFLSDGTNLQAALIRQGYGIAFTTPPNDRMSRCYQQQEAKAIKAKRGIWALSQYQIKSVRALTQNSAGFHRLEGVVTRSWQGRRSVTLLIDDQLEVRIFNHDLANFNVYMLNNIKNKKLRVRGWLHLKDRKKSADKMLFTMNLRHPDAIKVLN